MTVRVLVLGGTADARHLAEQLAVDPTFDVTTALAGRTAHPRRPAGTVRIGGFGGADGLADWLRAQHADAVVDATHPFATTITGNAVEATRRTGTPLLLLRRPGWPAAPNRHWVDTPADVVDRLPTLGRRVFLTTGRTDLTIPTALPQLWFLMRSVDPPTDTPRNVTPIQGTGPFTETGELALLREHRIDVLVTRDSGGDPAKLDAATTHGIPVLLIRRPAPPDGVPAVDTVSAAVAWLAR